MTTTVLRPNASVSGTATGAGSVHAALSDNSDSSYVTPIAEVQMGTVAMSGGVTKTLRARARVAVTSGSHISSNILRNAATGSPWTAGIISNAGTSSLSSTSPVQLVGSTVAVNLSQAEVDSLTMFAAGINPLSFAVENNTAIRAYEFYADLVWVAKPVVAVDAVSDPYPATTVPITWENTLDADGAGQVRYWAKAFTAAQYGAGGFDPETSSAFFDSGDTVSSALGTSVGPLSNGVTFRVYVKVAQTVNAASHWSNWDYIEFTIDVDTADVDAVTTIADDATAKITVVVDRDTGSEAWESIEVQRSVDGGSTWNYVRGARNVADATDQFIVVDYGVGNGESVSYRARATRVVSSLPITGEWVSSTSTSWSSTATWLKDPDLPERNLRVRFAVVPQFTRPRPQVVSRVLSSPNSIPASDVLGLRVGTIVLLTTTLDEAAALETLFESATLLLQTPPSHGIGSMYVTCGDVTPEYLTRLITDPHRRWVVPVIESIEPADPDAVI
jgi:hypothetical protein